MPKLRLLIWVAMLLVAGSARASQQFIEFLYIYPGEGSASGGHAAIKFENEVFHFQHITPGLLRIHRDDFAAFRFAYGYQENRTIAAHRIKVDDSVFQALRDVFNRRLLIQNQQFDGLNTLIDDQALMLALEQRYAVDAESPNLKGLDLEALGYFLDAYKLTDGVVARPTVAQNHSQQLAKLKLAIAAEYGVDFLQHKRLEAKTALQTLQPILTDQAGALAMDRFPTSLLGFAQRYKNLLLNLAALDVLESSIAPRPETLLTAALPGLNLSQAMLVKLSAYRQTLFMDLVKLLNSGRYDWGYPLLVGMARLHAVEQSLVSERLVVLDRSLPTTENHKAQRINRENLADVLGYAEKKLDAAIYGLQSQATVDEHTYNGLELAATGYLKMFDNSIQKNSILVPELSKLPSIPAQVEMVALDQPGSVIADYAKQLRNLQEEYSAKLQSLYKYQLLSRNCVTEIFQVIHAGIQQQADVGELRPESIVQLSQQWLGGYVAERPWNSIPFAAFDAVGSQYRLDSSYMLQSYRERQIDGLYQSTSAWLVDLSESNILTSAIYNWYGDDAAFLFFTQDAVWPRPLLGGANMAVAMGQGLYGLLALPWDAGENLKLSLTGLFMSFPELFFVNIRKGTFPGLLPGITQVTD